MRRINEQRASYSAQLIANYPEVVHRFPGCRLIIVDGGSEPLLPKIHTKNGQAHLSEIAEQLHRLSDGISTLEVGKTRVRRYEIGPSHMAIWVRCKRVANSEAGIPPQLNWTGGYVPDVDYFRTLLADSVRAKITAGYSKPTEEFWLLLCSSDIIPQHDDAQVVEAAAALEGDHPFDQVWFLFPYSNQNLGHLVKIWPREMAE